MTRFLSTSLQAQEPFFRIGLQQLEAANGHPNTDIHLTMDVMHKSKRKLLELGLDPKDTTAEELFHALQVKVAADDKRLSRTLQTLAATHISAEGDVIAGMVHALNDLPESKRCFAIKQSVMKSLIKKLPPKKAMKRLGYRSVDSLLKNETVTTIMATSWLSEGTTWQQKLLDSYKKLRPSDFEVRNMSIVKLSSKRWKSIAEDIVVPAKHTILPFKELGAVVILPLPQNAPSGSVMLSLTLALHQMNEIRACSSFLKLSQVRADFGNVVRSIAVCEPQLTSSVLDRPVPWHLVQRYYARLNDRFHEAAFEPHVQLEDMVWTPIEQALSHIEPALKFWENTDHIGMLHGDKAVSFHVIDVALNYCNSVLFSSRITQYFQVALWHELLLGYLQHDSVERSVLQELQPSLATELALA